MAEYFVAKSYENYERIGEPFEKSGRMYTKVKCKCDRCAHGVYAIGVHNGELIPHPAYGGVCLKCNGTGFIEKTIRLYTAKEYAVVEKAAERRAKEREETRAQEAIKRAARRQAISEANKKLWFEKNGFDINGITYCVYGDDTYLIKEHLKELGCKFSPLFMWHSPEPIELPEGYGTFKINYNDYMTWDTENDNMIFKEDAKEKIERRFDETKEPSLSEYVGEIGERLRNLTVVFSSRRQFQSYYGLCNIYTFKFGNNVLIWRTTKELKLEHGMIIKITGTVKQFNEYKGIKQTILTRCIIDNF